MSDSILISSEMQNITSLIENSASEISQNIQSSIWQVISPIVKILGGIFAVYIIYLAVQAVLNHLLRKRVRKIEKNLENLNKKTDEIISILNRKRK